jgi:hypothetical protein
VVRKKTVKKKKSGNRPGPRPEPVPRVIPVPRPLPPLRTEKERRAAIDAAVRFIISRQRFHKRQLSWAVGEHLFTHIYRQDVEYLRKRDPGKDDSLRDIAAQTGVPYTSLYRWTNAALVRRLLAHQGIDSRIAMTLLADLAQLGKNIEALGKLARWAEENAPTRRELLPIIRRWKRHLDEGGTLSDLVPGKKKTKKRKRRSPLLPPDEADILRLLQVLLAWARVARMSERNRGALRKLVGRMRALLEGRR